MIRNNNKKKKKIRRSFYLFLSSNIIQMTFNWFNETLLYVVIWTNNEENAKFFTDTSSKVMTSSLPVSYNLHAKHRVFEMTTERGWLYSRSSFETHPVHVSSPFLRNSLGHLPSLINIKTERKRERYPLDFECKRDRSSLIILIQRKWFVDQENSLHR